MNKIGFRRVIPSLLLILLSVHANAAIMVPAGGVTQNFAVPPTGIEEWCTLTLTGGATAATNLTQLDVLAQTIDATSTANVAVPTLEPTAAQATAGWNGGLLFTRPTQVAGNVLIAKLQNASGLTQSSLVIKYDLGISAEVVEEITGHAVYYSLTGTPNSWTRVGQYGTAGLVSFSIELGAWASGAPLYVMWMDDNGSGTPDTLETIDNVVFGLPTLEKGWVAYNDHQAGAGTAANVTTYSMTTTDGAGGPLTDFSTGLPLTARVSIQGANGTINGVTGSSQPPNPGTPAYDLFNGKVDFLSSALYFGPDPYSAAVTLTFTNLTPGKRYRFQGTAVRGNNYTGRWTLVTLAGASSAVPAHQAGTGSPGIVTNGWSPYGDQLAPLWQAAFNSGENRCGDVIGWDDIVPVGNSFSVICSNYHALLASGAAVPGGMIEDTYCYAINAFRLEEVGQSSSQPTVTITAPANNAQILLPTNVAIQAALSGFTNSVSNVVFYANATPLGEVAAAPYTFLWTNATPGTHVLTAVATDASGLSVTSAPVSIRALAWDTIRWTAYNDHTPGALTGPNVTTYNLRTPGGGPLLNQATGAELPVRLLVSNRGNPISVQYGGQPQPGSATYNIFNGYVDFFTPNTGTAPDNGSLVYASSGQSITLTFTNLDVTKRYGFRGSSIRASTDPRRWTLVSIVGATAFTDAHSTGCVTAASLPASGLGPGQAAYNGGMNVTNSDTVGWDNIIPGPDGTFSIISTQYLGPIWGGDTANNPSYPGYAINGFRLEQFPGGPRVVITAPTNGTSLAALGGLTITASATSDSPLTKVEFYAGATRLGQALTSPYSVTWPSVPAGNHLLTAVATDEAGLVSTSAPVRVVALPPGIWVGARGYTNSFDAAPPAAEWSTANSGGSAGTLTTPALVDIAAQVISAGSINQALPVVEGNPAAQNPLGVYSRSGFLQTSPTSVAYACLMATLVNNSGADAAAVRIRYRFTTNAVAENVPGHRVYYSQTGAPGSWVAIPALSSQPGGVLDAVVNLNSVWSFGSPLYLLWLDANFSGTDMICQMDDFAVEAMTIGFTVSLTSPLPDQALLAGSSVPFSATASSPNGIANVAFYANDSLLFTDSTSPYASTVTNLPVGQYAVYAVATDNLGLTAYSATNVLRISPPYIVYDGGTYSETFDSMGPTGTTTPPGWFVGPAAGAQGAIGKITLAAGDGSTSLETNWNLGTLGSSDRALGSQASSRAGGDLNLEVRILNHTASNIASFALTYDGEQWRANGVTEYPQYLSMYYSTNGVEFALLPPAFTFTSRVDSGTTGLDGNQAANRTAGLGGVYTPADPIPPGAIFYLRWYDTNNAGQDHQLAIDNVAFAAVTYTSLQLACRLAGPADGAVFVAPTNLPLVAIASGTPAATNVDFYADGVLIGSAAASPFSLVWSNPPLGSIALTAVATGDGASATSAVVHITILSNAAPAVSLTGPADGARFMAPASMVLSATASDDFGISAVAFYAGANLLGTAEKSPYTWNWTGVPAGTYPLAAVATDVYGVAATSAVVTVVVTNNAAPAVALTSPANNAVIAAPTNVLLTATASDSDGVVTGVEFFLNGGKLGEDNTAPYSLTWSNVLLSGVYSLYAVATDNAGVRATSAVVSVTVNGLTPPTVAITAPANNATFTSPANVTIQAAAGDSDGSVTNVAFYAGTTLLGQMTAGPFNFAWSNVTVGSYVLTAVAYDSTGLRATSAPVAISVISPIGIPLNLTYSLATLPPATDWSTLAIAGGGATYTDTAQLDAAITNLAAGSINQALGEVTAYNTRETAGWNSVDQSVYLRVTSQAASLLMATLVNSTPATLTTLNVSYTFGLGSAATAEEINGLRAYYSVSGAPGSWKVIPEFSTNATGTLSAILDLGAWPSGSLMYIIWADDNGNGMTDTAWYLKDFLAEVPGPIARLTSPANNALLVLPDHFLLAASVASFTNTITNVTFTANGLTLGTVTNSPFQFLWTNATPGTYQLRATAIEEGGFSAVSAPITVRVQNNTPPVVVVANPADGSSYTAPSDIAITIAAADSEGTVTNVEVLANGNVIAQRAVASFSFIWPSVPIGIYDLTAVAKDNLGFAATSSVTRVFVLASSAPTVDSFVPAGGPVSNLTQITVNFSEPVDGVKASDLRINGQPAAAVSGANATYTFSFPAPREGVVVVTWAANHAIVDRESPPKPFNGSLPGESAQYTLTDTVPPLVTLVSPAPGATVPALTRVAVTFSEPVAGVDAADLLLNGVPALQVSGAQAGPYTFDFAPIAGPAAQLSWATNHAIRDLAQAANAFAGGAWEYVVDLTAPETSVVINEIMYHPASENSGAEYVELHNRGAQPVRLFGWRLTGGVDFNFPEVTVPAGGYLVVAANLAVFNATYPGVTNVVGGWAGKLSNREDDVRLRNALGTLIDSVHYATEGDWAIRQRGPNDGGYYGWEWYAAHDGSAVNTATGATEANKTLELMNPAMPNDNGQNWATSAPSGGTPGRANSAQTNDIAPLIYEVIHTPAIPNATQTVAVTARIVDEAGAPASAALYYRDVTSTALPAFAVTNMVDDGLHGDGAAGDGVFGAVLPALPLGTIIEFYVAASDAAGHTRTWPAAARQRDGTFAQTANAHYQVDEDSNNPFAMPYYRLILTGAEAAEFQNLSSSNPNSDAEMNATFITRDGSGVKVRYNCSVRIRGAGSRGRPTKNWRVNIPVDRLWNGLSEINLNSQVIHAQLAGSLFSLRSGLPCAAARPVQVRLNGVNRAPSGPPPQGNGDWAGFGTYLFVEPINGEWAASHFPDDSGGNAYRGSIYPWTANLDYLGTNPQSYVSAGYSKTSNQSENDWSDLIALTYALSPNTPDNAYVEAVKQNANPQLFMRFFAVCTIVSYYETSLCRGVGDDYAMYRGVKDARFLLIPHDFDTILGQGDSGPGAGANWTIWQFLTQPPTTAANQYANFLNRFMRHQEFAPLYYAELKRLCDTSFSSAEMNATLDQALGGWVPASTITAMKTYVSNRNAYVRSQIPLSLTVTTGLGTQNGYLYTTSPNVTLTGRAHAIDTRVVKVGDSLATWSAFDAAWTNTVTLQPGINRLTVRAYKAGNVEFDSATVEIWYDDSSLQTVSSPISVDTTWTAAGGPYNIATSLTIANGATLTIQPGTTVYFGSGANLTVASGGRLLAEGTANAPIRFTRAPGSSVSWGGITINGGAGSPETRIAYAHFEYNGSTAIHSAGGTVFLDHLTFGNPAVQYVSLDNSSFVVQDCVFPAPSAAIEPVHGTGGIKAGGQGIFRRNFVGRVRGYSDAFDFTGGNRPGPILQVINNVFMGSEDDLLDLDGTDAWIAGNIFLHTHRSAASPDSSSAVSGGNDGGQTSEITIVGNLFYDVDQAALAKQGNFYTFLNNTIVKQNGVGSVDPETAVVILADENTAQGAGIYLEGNIIYEAEQLTRHWTNAVVTYTNNLITRLAGATWTGPGGGNVDADPLFNYVPAIAETTNFTTWAQAQVMWDWFSLRTGSPAAGRGPGGRDQGAVGARGVYVAGAPEGVTAQTSATLTVGFNLTGNGVPSGFPNGSGYTHYQWRLDGGAWSAETPMATPITLSGLASGPHFVEVIGKNDAGLYQDAAVLGADAVVTRSKVWIVNPSAPNVRLNEVLARNDAAVPVNGAYPDLIELYNSGLTPADLSGMSLSDSASNPRKFVFPPGTVLDAGQYLVVYADNLTVPAGHHTGFTLKQEGDDLHLFAANGQLLDSVVFGLQAGDWSIGRLTDGQWALTIPTFGAANRAAPIGNPATLKINEWLAAGSGATADFIELFNPDTRPVALSGLHLTDAPEFLQGLHRIAPLSFIAGGGYAVFVADGNADLGPDHLGFQLAAEQGQIGLFDAGLQRIDWVSYGPQTNDVAFGRSPNGAATFSALALATPGGPNPALAAQFGAQLVINEVMAKNISALTNAAGATPEWIELYNATTNAIDLSDMSLSDDNLQPRKYVFPDGMVLPSRGYLLLWCDGGAPASANNTGFGISANGGQLYLYDKGVGGGPIDHVAYGVQANDFSIGRVADGGTNWVLTLPTAAGPNIPAALGNPANLKINEWMADPASGADWFELYNPEPQPVALGGLWLTDDIRTQASRQRFQIPPLSFIGTELYGYERFWADNSAVAAPDHCNFALKASGEWLGISAADGTLIDGVTFGPQTTGVSEGRLPDGASNLVAFPATATPADANYLPLTSVVINEVLSAWPTNSNLEDAIELHNPTAAPVDVTGWYLSNARRALRKFQIPATVITNPGPVYVTNRAIIPAGGYLVFYQNQFYANPDEATSFTLNGNREDQVYLAGADADGRLTGYRAEAKFGAAEPGVSFGRHTNSAGNVDFTALSGRTFGVDNPDSLPEFRQGAGLANAGPLIGPIVFSEIMYRPPDFAGAVDNVRDEFVELFNRTTNTVPLFDPANPAHTWRLRGGVDYDFPTNVSLPAGGYLLVVSFDPVNDTNSLAAFRAAYPALPANAALFGPYTGKLNNNGERVELERPAAPVPADQPDAGLVPYVLVEQVKYNQVAPWDAQADGTGYSLQRLTAAAYGNEPTNWLAGAPSPGAAYSANPDTDGDGIPDAWVQQYFGHPSGLVGDQSRAGDDPDRDGMNNLQEYLAGTSPVDPSSVLRILSVLPPSAGTNAPIEFFAVSNRSYTVEFKSVLDTNGWSALQNYPAAATNRLIQVPVPPNGFSGFLRLRTP